ncbi:THO complex subunit 7 homolog [Cylas formicarius]|uniref:THO complex subunit 7 homolog n=1 Tax=Cylas formicarius TaxID=197179 RepID=UPI0029583936|nr:THO complex subunit 7 homolog [Cylas formicarius]
MSEEEVIKRRLIFDGDGTGEDRRLNVLLRTVSKWINSNEDAEEESSQIYDKILAHLALVKHSRKRSEYVAKSNAEQLLKYKALYAQYETNINETKEEIIKQKVKLQNAKVIKNNRIQYDLLAKAIAKEPRRADMIKKLEVLQKDLTDLAEEKRQLDINLEKRRKQFHVLATSANELENMLIQDHMYQSKSDCKSEPMSE